MSFLEINQNKIKWYSLAIFFLLNLFIWQQVLSYELNNELKVVFLDVGQGDAILIESPSGNQVLIDGGSNDQVLRALSGVMSPFDRTIDIIIATHPDSDHIGGLVSVLERFKSDLYIESGSKSETLVYKSLESTLLKEGIERIIARRGQILDLGDGVELHILFPDRDVSRLEANTASVVAQLVYGETGFMLTGDSPASIEKYLISISGKELESDVLKVGHHGSKTSTAVAFLGLVSPEYSVISAGEDNRYSHPHQEVIERLENFGTEIWSTAESGAITFVSNGREVRLK